jgi:hypothetical protein
MVTFIHFHRRKLLLYSMKLLIIRMHLSSSFVIRTVGDETGSTLHVGHWLAYCTCPGWVWWWRIWWNEDWQGKPKYSEKTCPSATLPTTNPTCQTRARTRAATAGSQRLTAWTMAWPSIFQLIIFYLVNLFPCAVSNTFILCRIKGSRGIKVTLVLI